MNGVWDRCLWYFAFGFLGNYYNNNNFILKSTLITSKGFSHHKEDYKSNRDKLTQHGTLNRNCSQQVTTTNKTYDQCSKKEIYNM